MHELDGQKTMWREDTPGASFAYPDAWTRKVLLQTLVMLHKSAELKL